MRERVEGQGLLRRITLPHAAQRDRLTGSQIYGFLKCEHSVWLDFHGDRARKLAPSAALERLLARGRDFEDEIVAPLGYVEPEYGRAEFAEGAEATRELMASGVAGISQGVLFDSPYLGIPDLLRREPGESEWGDWHYVVGDVKSSWRSRSDQALQVVFYSAMLAELQGRLPEYGYLILRDGREERFAIAELLAVLDEVLEETEELLAAESKPHRSLACRDCAWREVCGEAPDAHWLPGLTRSTHRLLEQAGYRDLEALRLAEPRRLARAGALPESTWQRARWGAEAALSGCARRVRRPRLSEIKEPATRVVWLRDPLDRRLPVLAYEGKQGASLHVARNEREEVEALRHLIDDVARGGSLLHGGGLRPLLYTFVARQPELAAEVTELEARCVDLMSIARGAYVAPGPLQTARDLLDWKPGDPLASAAENGDEDCDDPGDRRAEVGLLLDLADWDALEALARAELADLAALHDVLRS